MCRKNAPREDKLYFALIIPAALFLLYFATVHFGVLEGYPLPAILVLIVAFSAGIFPRLKHGERSSWFALIIVLAAGIALWMSGYLVLLFYLPSLLINLMLLLAFGVSLLPGSTPLITQFSKIMKGELDAKALRYTYRVTFAWAVFFALLFAETLLLALFAPARVWSFFANFMNYVFLFLFFIVEYRIRVYLFPEVEHPGFFGFIRDLLRLDRRNIGMGLKRESGLSREGERG